jgi:hypothetical protein
LKGVFPLLGMVPLLALAASLRGMAKRRRYIDKGRAFDTVVD